MPTPLPSSPAALRNASSIEEVLRHVLIEGDTVVEIGAGTGEHAVHMARAFPKVRWRPTDLPAQLPLIEARVRQAVLPNLDAPTALDAVEAPTVCWEELAPTVIYTANTFHIMPPTGWVRVVDEAAARLPASGRLVVYGPFRYTDRPLELSNQRFEELLQREDPQRGLRVQEQIVEHAEAKGLTFVRDVEMPANNRCLVFTKQA